MPILTRLVPESETVACVSRSGLLTAGPLVERQFRKKKVMNDHATIDDWVN